MLDDILFILYNNYKNNYYMNALIENYFNNTYLNIFLIFVVMYIISLYTCDVKLEKSPESKNIEKYINHYDDLYVHDPYNPIFFWNMGTRRPSNYPYYVNIHDYLQPYW